jgi:carboxylate-amine ligase
MHAGYWRAMETRTLGVEEELLVIDPGTSSAVSRARDVLRADDTGDLDSELFRHQLEIRTEPALRVDDVVEQLVRRRRAAGEAAAACDLGVAACAAVPLGVEEPEVTPDDRYRDMVETFGEVARLGSTCGMHVHVAVESEEEGVACLDRIARWLPVLLAVSTNSPFAAGRDTGYASWRTQMWSTWPSAGPSETFGSVAGYRRACDRMIASGAARDRGMLYWDARLSDRHPTLEVRLLDVTTDVADAALLAALVRALVESAAEEWRPGSELVTWRSEELRAARWRAARYGLSADLLDPATHELKPARDVVMALVDLVGARLDRAGDTALVEAGVQRVLGATGATRQRSAYERTATIEGVVADLLTRTAESWSGDALDRRLSQGA